MYNCCYYWTKSIQWFFLPYISLYYISVYTIISYQICVQKTSLFKVMNYLPVSTWDVWYSQSSHGVFPVITKATVKSMVNLPLLHLHRHNCLTLLCIAGLYTQGVITDRWPFEKHHSTYLCLRSNHCNSRVICGSYAQA